MDTNECLIGAHDCGNATCINEIGKYSCLCSGGFEIRSEVCLDIDECSIGTHNCPKGCINTIGSFSCEGQVPTRSFHEKLYFPRIR